MGLSDSDREEIKVMIDEILKPHGLSSPVLNKMIWKYEHDFDFRYGQKSGFITGMVSGYLIGKHEGGIIPEDEAQEISEMIQLRIDEIRKSVS